MISRRGFIALASGLLVPEPGRVSYSFAGGWLDRGSYLLIANVVTGRSRRMALKKTRELRNICVDLYGCEEVIRIAPGEAVSLIVPDGERQGCLDFGVLVYPRE